MGFGDFNLQYSTLAQVLYGKHVVHASEVLQSKALLRQFVLKQYPVLTLQQTTINVRLLHTQSWQRSVRHQSVQHSVACTGPNLRYTYV